MLKYFCYITISVVSVVSVVAQAQQQRIYLANDEHTDYMWTANEASYDSVFVKMLDYYLDQIEATKNNPSDFQARFNCDGSLWVSIYKKYRSHAQFLRLIDAIKSNHISVPITMLASTYGAQPSEAVLRGMYYAGQMERQYKLRLSLAVSMENQTLPLGLSSLWAGSGAKYSWRGVCACASKIHKPDWVDRGHPLYRYTGLDKSGVIMKWYNQSFHNASLGGYAETRMNLKSTDVAFDLGRTVDTLSALCNSPKYPYDVAGAFGYGWDDLQSFVSPEFILAAQKGTNESRKVRVSNEQDFFEDVERSYPHLPTETKSYGNEWDLYCASMNETTAKVKRAVEKLRTAEALASIVSLANPSHATNLEFLKNQAWEGLGVYWEHDWTADGPVKAKDRALWQNKIQQHISAYSDTLFKISATALANQLQQGEHPRFYVFNALGYERDDVADLLYADEKNIKVTDLATGRETAHQFVKKEGRVYLRIWAEKIPSVGYKVFEIKKDNSSQSANDVSLSNGYIENKFFKLKFHPSGVLSELYDKVAGNRQMVKASNGRFFNDLGSTDINNGEPIKIESDGPVSTTFKTVSNDPLLHTVRLTLYKNIPRLEIENTIHENFADVKTWAFSFNIDECTTQHEELGAVLIAKKENNGGHYSEKNARTEWLTFNHFANLSERNYNITISNLDCSFFKLGHSTADSLFENSSQLHALAGGQVDGDKLGIPAQNADTVFNYHFAVTSSSGIFDPVASMKFSLNHQNPLLAVMITGQIGNTNKTYSLLKISDPNVLIWSVKPAEEGIAKGMITRIWNMQNVQATPVVHFVSPVNSIWQTTHIETDERQLKAAKNSFESVLDQHQIKTFRISFKQRNKTTGN